MSKYHARKITVYGITFDSRKEAARYGQLRLMEKAGIITDLRRQVKYELIPKQEGERPCSYIADFVYDETASGEHIVEDVKGCRTKEYIIKRKLMLYRYGIHIREV